MNTEPVQPRWRTLPWRQGLHRNPMAGVNFCDSYHIF